MESIFLKLVNSDLVNITKPKYNKLISYGYFFDFKLVYSVLWMYKYYFEESVILYLPKCVNIEQTLSSFNELVGDYTLSEEDILQCSLETIEIKKTYKVVIYGFADFIFNELLILNKRRTLTYVKNLKSKIHILSYSSLKALDIPAFDSFDFFKMGWYILPEFNYIDFLDTETDNLIDFIEENKDKRIYLSLSAGTSKILQVEKELKEREIHVSRKEESQIVINSSKTIKKSFLKNKYDIYIFITESFEFPLDILCYLKEIQNSEVYFDSMRIKSINSSLKQINSEQFGERINIKESKEYDSYDELQLSDCTIASEGYYCFDAPQSIQSFDLQNLTKKEYDAIRNFVKLKLIDTIDVKTCQLSAPCSPKDRSKKLNSLSNKISSYDYRCDVTCEIFKNYTIGVVLWNETFADRKTFNVVSLKNQTFVYQTTSGTWKYTTIN
jgi:hypothetical protein